MLNKQLKTLRSYLGLTQAKVAEMLNVTDSCYANYEMGIREPDIETIKKLCVIFNCTTDELLEFDEYKHSVQEKVEKK